MIGFKLQNIFSKSIIILVNETIKSEKLKSDTSYGSKSEQLKLEQVKLNNLLTEQAKLFKEAEKCRNLIESKLRLSDFSDCLHSTIRSDKSDEGIKENPVMKNVSIGSSTQNTSHVTQKSIKLDALLQKLKLPRNDTPQMTLGKCCKNANQMVYFAYSKNLAVFQNKNFIRKKTFRIEFFDIVFGTKNG